MEMRRLGILVLIVAALLASGCKPRIVSYSPTGKVTMTASQTQVFTVKATGGKLQYAWTLDGAPQTATTNTFSYSPTVADLGAHTLTVTVSNPEGQASHTWKITVLVIDFSWDKSYGGNGDDVANAIAQTSDGGFIVAGSSSSDNIAGTTNHGGRDCYVLRLNASGALIWQTLYGGSGTDAATAVQPTADGGFIVAGFSNSTDIAGTTNHGGQDVYVIKLNSNGTPQWQTLYGTSANEEAQALQITQDGGYILSGMVNPTNLTINGLVIKLNASGSVAWQQTYASGALNSICETTDGAGTANGYIVCGAKDLWPGCYVARTDLMGNITWDDTFRLNLEYAAAGSEVRQTADGGFVVTGATYKGTSSNQQSSTSDCYTVKLSPTGAKEWDSIDGGLDYDAAFGLALMPEANGFILAGTTKSQEIPGVPVLNPGVSTLDVYIGVLDAAGNCIYQERHGGLGLDDGGFAVTNCSDGFIIAGKNGNASHDVYLLKYAM